MTGDCRLITWACPHEVNIKACPHEVTRSVYFMGRASRDFGTFQVSQQYCWEAFHYYPLRKKNDQLQMTKLQITNE